MTERSRFWDGTATGDASVAPYDAPTEFAEVLMSMAKANDIATHRSGVWKDNLNELVVSGIASPVSVAAGRALVYGSWYENDAAVSVAVSTPSASTRIDRIVLRKSWANQTVRVTRIEGTEGGAAPALTQVAGTTWDMPLAQASITTGGVITVTDERDFLAEISPLTQLINEIKGFPAIVAPDVSLPALGLWWRAIGAPTGGVQFVDLAGEAGITETYEYSLKVLAASSGDGLQQTWTYADEHRVKSGRKLSALVAVWVPSGRIVTVKLVTSTPTEVSVASTSVGRWEILAVEGLVLDGTTVSLQATIDGAATFYLVPLGCNIGPKAFPLPPRPLRFVDKHTSGVVNGVDPGGAGYTDVDLTASTSPLAVAAQIVARYTNSVTSMLVLVRRNGDTTADDSNAITSSTTANTVNSGSKLVPLDDGQIFEYRTSGVAGDTESVSLDVAGYWEWA